MCSEANDNLVLTGKVVDNLFKLQSQLTSVNIDLLSENDDDDDNDNHDDSDHELRTATEMLSENREADVCRNANVSNDNVSFDNNVNIVPPIQEALLVLSVVQMLKLYVKSSLTM